MSLTRKDFKVLASDIARILNRIREETDLNKLARKQITTIILEEIKGFCRWQNGLFDSNRFEGAIRQGLNEEIKEDLS